MTYISFYQEKLLARVCRGYAFDVAARTMSTVYHCSGFDECDVRAVAVRLHSVAQRGQRPGMSRRLEMVLMK